MVINFNNLGASGGGSGSGSTVSWRQDLTAGTQIAQITINGTPQSVYAPSGGSGSDIVQNYQIVSALTDVQGEESTQTISGYTFDFSAITSAVCATVASQDFQAEYVSIIALPEGDPQAGLYININWEPQPLVDDNQWHTYNDNDWEVRRNGNVVDTVSPSYSGDEFVDVADYSSWEPSTEVPTGTTSATLTVKTILEGTVAGLIGMASAATSGLSMWFGMEDDNESITWDGGSFGASYSYSEGKFYAIGFNNNEAIENEDWQREANIAYRKTYNQVDVAFYEGVALDPEDAAKVGNCSTWIQDFGEIPIFENACVFYQRLNNTWAEVELGGGDTGSTAASEYLPSISELPANPESGAVYNYNGKLIKYVNGAGNWGEWTGVSGSTSEPRPMSGRTITLTYAVLPSSLRGQLVATLNRSALYKYIYLDEYEDKLNVTSYEGGSAEQYCEHNGSAITINLGSSYSASLQWVDNAITIVPNNGNTPTVSQKCSTETNDGHWELVVSDPDTVIPESSCGSVVTYDAKGRVTSGVRIADKSYKINNTYYYCASARGSNDAFPATSFIPTASGATGTILVSAGNTAPVWQTLSSALGIQHVWSGTQAQYDALAPNYDSTTLYLIVEE